MIGGMENRDFSDFGDLGSENSNLEDHIIKVSQTYFVPYLDILEDCGTRCKKVEKINYKWLSDELLDTFYDRLQYTIFLKDGSIIYISLNNNGIKIFDILISVDINGRKGPNVVGKDVFCYMAMFRMPGWLSIKARISSNLISRLNLMVRP